jgi:hypothetical protein
VVVVAAISSITVWWLVSGLPRQLMLMKLNRRCSIWGEMPARIAVEVGLWACKSSSGRSRVWRCRVEGWLGGDLGGGFQGDREAERLELGDEATGLAFGVLAGGEVVVAEIFEHLARAEEMPDELD